MWIQRVGAEVQSVAYAPDGRSVYTSEGGRISAWDIASREPTRLFRAGQLMPPSRVSKLVPVGNRYLLLDAHFCWRVWNIEAKKQLVNINLTGGYPPVASGSTAARFISSNGQTIRACNLATGKITTVLQKPSGFTRMQMFAFSPDDRFALVTDAANCSVLVTVATGKSVPIPNGNWETTFAIHFTTNGNIVRAIGDYVRVYKVTKPNKLLAEHPWSYTLFALNPSEPIYAALNKERQFTLYSLDTGEVLRTFEFELGRSVRCACFSPDGLTCAVGGTNKQFAVFDVDL